MSTGPPGMSGPPGPAGRTWAPFCVELVGL